MICHRCGSLMGQTKWGTLICTGCDYVSEQEEAVNEVEEDDEI